MIHILSRLADYGIGKVAATEELFFHICEIEDIEIVWSDKRFSFYFSDPKLGIYCIVLPKRRKGLRLLFEMFHELGHHCLSGIQEPTAAFCWQGYHKDELDADSIALVALIPKSQLKEMAWLDGSRYGAHLYNERLRLFFLYGI